MDGSCAHSPLDSVMGTGFSGGLLMMMSFRPDAGEEEIEKV
jgi:hypothetical protein